MTIDTVFIQSDQIKAFIEGENQEVKEENPNDNQVLNNETKEVKKKQGKDKKEGKQQKKQKKEVNLKSILAKMVPYINFPYAEHVLKSIGADPNSPATMEH